MSVTSIELSNNKLKEGKVIIKKNKQNRKKIKRNKQIQNINSNKSIMINNK